MIPWPIALLSLAFGAVATLSTALVWKILLGTVHQSIAGPAVWMIFSGGACLGLALMQPWGRRLGIWTGWLLIAATLAAAAVLSVHGRPVAGLIVTFSTAGYYLVIRYLSRPQVRAWFGESSVKPTVKS